MYIGNNILNCDRITQIRYYKLCMKQKSVNAPEEQAHWWSGCRYMTLTMLPPSGRVWSVHAPIKLQNCKFILYHSHLTQHCSCVGMIPARGW